MKFRFLCLLLAIVGLSACQYPSEEWRNLPLSYAKPGLCHQSHLTWRLDTLAGVPAGMLEADVEREVSKSFRSWEGAGVFRFDPSAGGKADIVVGFKPMPGTVSDGPAGNVARSAYPWSAHRGHIYLDPSEYWTTASFSLFKEPISDWLPHEIGHSMGLLHCQEPGQTMSEMGPYHLPDEFAFAMLRRLYCPGTPVLSETGVVPTDPPQVVEGRALASGRGPG